MAQSNFTPIQLYRTSTAAAAPSAGDLAAGELAINLTDEKLYFKNAGGTVKLLASSSGSTGSVSSVDVSGGTTGLTTSGGPITGSGTITLAGTLAVANGGTGAATLTANSVLIGNGTSAVQTVAPGTSGNVLTSNGTTWTSAAAPAGSEIIRVPRTSNTQIDGANLSNLIDITSGTFTQTFVAAATLGSGWFCYIYNNGTGDITLDPNGSETIDGLTSYIMYPGEARIVQCNGTSFTTILLKGFSRAYTTTTTWTKPPGYTSFYVSLWGAGGGGGSAGGAGGAWQGSGGGGGAYAFGILPASTLSSSVTVTIGAGGSGGGGSGGTGGTSSFSSIYAFGGGGGGNSGSSSNYGGSGGGLTGPGGRVTIRLGSSYDTIAYNLQISNSTTVYIQNPLAGGAYNSFESSGTESTFVGRWSYWGGGAGGNGPNSLNAATNTNWFGGNSAFGGGGGGGANGAGGGPWTDAGDYIGSGGAAGGTGTGAGGAGGMFQGGGGGGSGGGAGGAGGIAGGGGGGGGNLGAGAAGGSGYCIIVGVI